MANNFASNFTEKLARLFLTSFESARVLSKNVNTQLLEGKYNEESGDTISFKRPHDYRTYRNSTGDLTSATKSDIIAGKASGTIQDYFTVWVSYNEADEAIKMADKGKPGEANSILGPMATRVVTDLEVDFASYMMKNSGLLSGTYGTATDAWSDVAKWGATMAAHGVPKDKKWCAAINPFTQAGLADVQRSLGAGGVAGKDIQDSHRMSVITENFAGMRVMESTALASYTSIDTSGDRAGIVASNPTVTYVGHKDTMIQSIAISGIGSVTGTIPAGTVVQITGRNRLNLSTRTPVITAAGANVVYTGVLTADASLTSGAGTIQVAGPAIYESNGQYNTTDSAVVQNDVVTLLGADDTLYQPNLFWHPDAFGIGSVPIKKLYSTDTTATTADGLQFRVSWGSDFITNVNQVRIDFRPAYVTFNPFLAGQGFGN